MKAVLFWVDRVAIGRIYGTSWKAHMPKNGYSHITEIGEGRFREVWHSLKKTSLFVLYPCGNYSLKRT